MVRLNRERELRKNPASTKYQEAENLIPEFVRVVNEAHPVWFLMENVPGVPQSAYPRPNGYHVSSFILNNRWLPNTTPQTRERRFWFGHCTQRIDLQKYIEVALFEPLEWEYAVTAAGSGGGAPVPVRMNAGGKPKRMPKSIPNWRTVEDYLRLQGLSEDFFDKDSPFTAAGKRLMVGNGVPLPMGRAVSKAIQAALKAVQP